MSKRGGGRSTNLTNLPFMSNLSTFFLITSIGAGDGECESKTHYLIGLDKIKSMSCINLEEDCSGISDFCTHFGTCYACLCSGVNFNRCRFITTQLGGRGDHELI